jgi:F420-dependent oxidoreductase-like protein
VPYGKPLARTREAVAIVRSALRRDAPLTHDGEVYQVPFPGGTGLGKPLKLMMAPVRADVPIYLAAIGPKNVALAAEIADGWLPVFYAPRHRGVFHDSLAGARGRAFDVAASVQVAIGDDLERCRNAVKPNLALYVGGMGAKGKNFYNDLARRYGYEDAAARIQELYLDGKKREAIAAVPDALVDDVALCGSRERIADQLGAWQDAGVTTLVCMVGDRASLRAMAAIRERL